MKLIRYILGLLTLSLVVASQTASAQTVTGTALDIGYSHILNSAPANTIAGGSQNENRSTFASVIGGGAQNKILTNGAWEGRLSVIGGGLTNTIDAHYSVIGGGSENKIHGTNGIPDPGNLAQRNLTTAGVIGGGANNTLLGVASVIGGGDRNFVDAWVNYSVIAGGLLNTIKYGSGYSVISGGTENVIEDGAWWAAINGGQFNEIKGSGDETLTNGYQAHFGWIGGGYRNYIEAAGVYGAIGGGAQNSLEQMFTVVGGGSNHTNAGPWGTIGGGSQNTIQTNAEGATIAGGTRNLIKTNTYLGTIGGGYENTIDQAVWATISGGLRNAILGYGFNQVIGGGISNLVTATSGTIPGGKSGNASHYGQMAYASGQFAAQGDAQTSVYVLRGSTTDGTQTEIFLDGISARMTLASGSTWTFDILISARSSVSTSAGYRITGVIDNNSGTTSLVNATPIKITLAEDVSAWDVVAQADDTNDALVIKVTGAASTNIRWVATVKTTEVSY